MTLDEAYESWRGEMAGYFAKSFGDAGLAEDCVQHAFSQAALHLPYLGMHPAALRAWLYAAARNFAIDQLRRNRRLIFADIPDRPDAREPDEADRQALRDALGTLTQVQQTLVRMRYGQGYNSAEIAASLQMTAVNVRYHLMTAMRRLRRELEEEEA